jgi:hypothetical protein
VIPDEDLPVGGAEEEEHMRRIREHQVIVLDNNSLASHNIGNLEIIEEEEDDDGILYTEESPLESLERPSSLYEGSRPRRRRASSLRDMRRNEHR